MLMIVCSCFNINFLFWGICNCCSIVCLVGNMVVFGGGLGGGWGWGWGFGDVGRGRGFGGLLSFFGLSDWNCLMLVFYVFVVIKLI